MKNQYIFKQKYVEDLIVDLYEGRSINKYFKDKFQVDEEKIILSRDICIEETPKLIMPGEDQYELKNSLIIFEAYKLNPVQATDVRLWTQLSHVEYWKYVQERSKLIKNYSNKDESEVAEHIIRHWFINPLSPKNLLRHDISKLWWSAYRTVDETRTDKYELTKALFSYQDLYRVLAEGTLGRIDNFLRAFLEFWLENEKFFESQERKWRTRALFRIMNRIGGYKLFSVLNKKEIKKIIGDNKESIKRLAMTMKTKDIDSDPSDDV